MPWIQLSIDLTPGEDPEPFEQALLEAGALSVTLSDAADRPVLEPAPGQTPIWARTRITGLFDARADTAAIEHHLRERLGAQAVSGLRAAPLEDRDWERAWMDDFRPMRFGQRLWVDPSGHPPSRAEGIHLRLDPGLAFGTGTHATTAQCLEWLDAHPPRGLEVIDYGCGSGVLGIAAALLGARSVIAVDSDPQALVATTRNAEANGVARTISVALPQEMADQPADLLLANILARPLIDLAQRFAALVRPGGNLVLSGILVDQVAEVVLAYAPWFELAEPKTREGWARLDGHRRGDGF